MEPINEGGILSIGTAFFRASPHAEVSVAEREHRLQLGEKFGAKRLFDDIPLVGRIILGWRPKAFMMEHRASSPKTARGVVQLTSSPRSLNTRCVLPLFVICGR